MLYFSSPVSGSLARTYSNLFLKLKTPNESIESQPLCVSGCLLSTALKQKYSLKNKINKKEGGRRVRGEGKERKG